MPEKIFYDDPLQLFHLKAFRYRLMTFIFLGLSLILSGYFLPFIEEPRGKVIAVQILKTGVSTGVSVLPLGDSTLLKQEKRQ